ncbi:hypothetical protein COU38_01090 [Candidatus Micrarchaeota archaeon CG10_big_fil_rev_8_21_14_0_10_54_18]|nr:MAG: hypothetical protein AUJ15_03320 [Candidatus Micrarchaeota archaeon CG1_02_55_41]PJD01437.1 MAG: hypothetical protein COU38_01090 [Candidatus Micrarchaeota archaeon CG10_big_fil_rev_8_21_14_0_10_54_18]
MDLGKQYGLLKKYYAASGFKFPFEVFVLIFFFAALAVGFVLMLLNLTAIISVFAFLAVMSMIVTIPISIRNSRVAAIDDALPDVLKHMALVLKAGGTVENALQEAASGGYGPLSADLKDALKELKEGKTFEAVLVETADNSGSILFHRTAVIIVDAKRAGAGLAGVMAEIAEDARDVLRIKRERVSRTMMHVLFILTSSVLLSPFIFGFTLTIVNYISTGISGAMPDAQGFNLCALNSLFLLFLAIETVIGSLAIGIIREGKIAKFILYSPVMVLVALLVFEAGKWMSVLIVGGKGIVC